MDSKFHWRKNTKLSSLGLFYVGGSCAKKWMAVCKERLCLVYLNKKIRAEISTNLVKLY